MFYAFNCHELRATATSYAQKYHKAQRAKAQGEEEARAAACRALVNQRWKGCAVLAAMASAFSSLRRGGIRG